MEQAEGVSVNAAAVVSAIQAYPKINAAGQWVDRTEQVIQIDLLRPVWIVEEDVQ